MGAYGTDEEDDLEHMQEDAGGQVTILGKSEDDEANGADLSHLTTAVARQEQDTAGTAQPAVTRDQEGQGAEDEGQHQAEKPSPSSNIDHEVQDLAKPDKAQPSLLPPDFLAPPDGECDPVLQQKVATWLQVQRTRGRYINTELRHSRGYRNPEFFRKMVEHLEIDEYGSSFPAEVFDPHGLPEEDYIDELQKQWNAEEERRKAVRQQTGRIEFTKSASQPSLTHNPLMPGLNPAAALAAAQLKAAQLAAVGVTLSATGASKGGKWDAQRR